MHQVFIIKKENYLKTYNIFVIYIFPGTIILLRDSPIIPEIYHVSLVSGSANSSSDFYSDVIHVQA